MKLDCSLGETVGQFSNLFKVALVTIVSRTLLLFLALSTLLLLLALRLQLFRLSC